MKKIIHIHALFLTLVSIFISLSLIAQQKGTPWTGDRGIAETVSQIMQRTKAEIKDTLIRVTEPDLQEPDFSHLKQNPLSKPFASYPDPANTNGRITTLSSPQTLGTSFTGATLTGTNPTLAYPPDKMGAVGPTQYIIAVNGRIVTFNKTTGVADGILNSSTNTFFSTVRNSSGTSDPRIRYDRITARWFIVIINVSTPNRILIAVSDAASAGVISGATVWTFFYIPIDSTTPTISNTCLADYPTLGIDVNALYIGTNNFCGSPSQTFNSTDGYVVRKSSVLGAGPIVVTVFRGLVPVGLADGPYTPQGVDNYDPAATEGYFIGHSIDFYGELVIRRVSNPGGTPSISSNILLTVNTTSSPISVPHLGNSGGINGNLDALDFRLFAAHLRNGSLWTAHNIEVDATGSAVSGGGRNGSRWYEIQNLTSTPSLVQSGTIFDASATNPASYFIPSVMVSGQGHAAFSLSSAGANNRANAATVGRLSSYTPGTTGTIVNTTSSSNAYNPANTNPRRWGDYSYVSLDPKDDMTMWMINQFCDATNSYGCNITKLIAPPPATPASCSPASVYFGFPAVTVTVTGTSISGSGFYDPGANLAPPALAFNHISATVSGGVTVNSVTYTDPTHITLSLNTTAASAGNQTITVTNPDGQSVTSASAILAVLPMNTWLTTGTTAWNTGTNWSFGTVPASGDNVYIPSGGTQPTLPSGTTTVGTIFLNGIITLGAGNTLVINGGVSGTGSLTGSSSSNLTLGGTLGTLNLTQTSAATRSLNNLTLNAGSSASLGTALDLYGTLALTTATLHLAGQNLTLKSNSGGTAQIANLTGSTLDGANNVTMERWIPAAGGNPASGGRRYRLLAPTVSTLTTINANWQEGQVNSAIGSNVDNIPGYGTQITGSGGNTNGFDKTQTNQSSLYLTTNGTTLAYTPIANTNVLTLNPLTGYFLFIRGSRGMNMTLPATTGMPTSSTTLRATGTLTSGSVSNSTNALSAVNGAFNLVTNPYPSPISWTSIYGDAANTHLASAYTYWDAEIGTRGGYCTVDNTGMVTGGGNGNVNIQPGQAFFVQTSGGTPSLTIKESHKSAVNNIGIFGPQTPPVTRFSATLYFNEVHGGYRQVADGVTAVFDNSFSAGLDGEDALEIANWDENIAIARNGQHLAIEKRPQITGRDSLPLFMENMRQMNYEWQFDAANFPDTSLRAVLVDHFTDWRTPLSVTGSTIVPFTVNSDPGSFATDRFMVVFSPAPRPTLFSTIKAYPKDRPGTQPVQGIQLDWIMQSETAVLYYEVERSVDSVHFKAIASVPGLGNSIQPLSYGWFDDAPYTGNNFYRVKAIHQGGQVKYSDIVNANLGTARKGITVFPNPVREETFTVIFNGMPGGAYTLRLFDNNGQLMMTRQLTLSENSASCIISAGSSLAKGTYLLEAVAGTNRFTCRFELL